MHPGIANPLSQVHPAPFASVPLAFNLHPSRASLLKAFANIPALSP